jgi:hypothetical protein
MAEVWTGLLGAGGGVSRRGAVRLLASGVAVVAGAAALSACGLAVPGSVATDGAGALNAATAQTSDPKSMVLNKGGTIQLVASGAAVGTTTADAASYYFGTATGDGTWICEVAKQGTTSTNSLAGIMARNDGTAGAAMVGVFLSPGSVSFRWRPADGQPGQQWPMSIAIGVDAPVWLQLAKSGNTFSCFYSQDGKTWENKTSMSVTFTNTTYLVGLVASASGSPAIDEFTHISGFKPSRFLAMSPTNTAENSSSSK